MYGNVKGRKANETERTLWANYVDKKYFIKEI